MMEKETIFIKVNQSISSKGTHKSINQHSDKWSKDRFTKFDFPDSLESGTEHFQAHEC